MEKEEEAFANVIPILTEENFGLRLNYNRYEEEIAHSEAFPSDFTLAKLANLAYKDKITIPPNLEDWEVLTYARNNRITDGYRGVAFFNPKMCHVVIAHRGTDKFNVGSLITDFQLTFKLFELKQAQSAASFAHLVAQEIKKVNILHENDHEKPPFRLTITGHSLGALLAQYTTFTVKYLTLNKDETQFIRDDNYLSNIHPHTVVFDSPGCKAIFEELAEKLLYQYNYRKYGNYETLDMTVYLNETNPINSLNRQTGTIYMLPVNTHWLDDIINYLAKGKVDKKVVLQMPSGLGSSIKQIIKMIIGSKTQQELKTVLAKDNRCSLNIFTESELEFIHDWYVMDVTYDSFNVKTFRDKYNIPKFKLDREYNLLKGKEEDIKKIIVIVKNLRPSKQIVFQMLKDNGGEEIYLRLFKNEVELFEKKFWDFNGYYFNDNYGLLQFFKSDKMVLHVRVDPDSSVDDDFETNIIRNVISYYIKNEVKPGFDLSKEKIAFFDWHKLCKFIRHNSSNFLKNYSLLVIEYYFEDENHSVKILEFLQNIKIKVIILSINWISFRESVDVIEANGFGNMLTFGDLNLDSQDKFLNRKIFKHNNQLICLNDLVKNITSGNESLINSFPMVSVLELILADECNPIVLDSHYRNLLKSVLFYDLYREINPYQMLHNLDESQVFILQEDNTKVDLSNVFSNFEKLIYIESIKDYEQQCFDNITQIKYLFTTKNSKVYLTGVFNYKFYIHRSIIHKRSVNSDIFKNTNDDLDCYIFYGDKNAFDNYVVSQQEDRFKFIYPADEAIEIAKLTYDNIHVFNIYKDGAIDWQKSYGSIDFLKKHMQNKEVFIQESDIVNDDRIIIISGEPGIGKSSIIEYLYLKLKDEYWIFPIQLKNCTFEGISDELTFDEVAKFITKNCSHDVKSIQHILSFCMQYETQLPIYLMMDSYDEIPNKAFNKKVINVINFLKYNSTVKIFITTRPHLSKELENGISVFASYFTPLNYETEIVTFLVDFWKSHLCLFNEHIDQDHLTSVAKNMLKSAQDTIGETVSAFIEIPMNIRLIAETVTPEIYVTSEFSDVLTLYNKYVQQRCDIYFRRFSLDPHPIVKKWLIESILGKISALSINKLLSNVDIQPINDEEMEEFYKVGLVYLDSNNLNYKFLHDSVCDYFISDFIKKWLTLQTYIPFVEFDVGGFLICDLFLKEELKKVRLFLNFHLKTIDISPNRLDLCKDKLAKICKDNYSLLFNDENESIFHICIKENLTFLLKYFLLNLLDWANAKKLLTEINIRLETPLYYAIIKTSEDDNANLSVNCLTILLNFLNDLRPDTDVKEILLATLFNYFISDKELDKLTLYIKNFKMLETIMNEINLKIPLIKKYLNACKENDSGTLKQILAELDNDEMIKTYLLKSTNKVKETGLHLTSNIEIAQILVKPFNINLQDHHGMTPLCRSIKEQRGDIAKMLIEQGASYVGDNFGVTPLIHASKYNLKEIVEIILNPNAKDIVDVNECNIFQITPLMSAARNGNEEIVTYLIEKEANIHLRDRNGLTAFHHAVKGDTNAMRQGKRVNLQYTRIVEILKKKGSDINTQDKHGTTPVFYSVKHKNFSMIDILLIYGADVNIGNLHGQYPLQRLMKENLQYPVNKKYDDYIKKFLSGEFTAPAKTHMLSEEEHSYIKKFLN